MAAIVIEGIDASGKTTLAREFEKHGYRYVHFGKPRDGENLFDTYLEGANRARTENYVFDRLHVGELVYGPVMRDRSIITVEQLRLINRVIYAGGGCVIFCRPPFDTCLSHWRLRHEREYVQEEKKFTQLRDIYLELMLHEFPANSPTLEYNYADDLGHLDAFVRSATSFPSLPPQVNGHPGARYLIVGERPGGLGDDAFCSMLKSSGFLNTCLWGAGYHEHELSFTNAFGVDRSRRDLMNIWTKCNRPVVIAAGNVAQEECLKQGVPYLPVHHPQYVKRFHLSKWREYVRQLKKFRGTE